MGLKKLNKAFQKLDQAQKELSASKEVDIALMKQFNENFKEVTQALEDYYKEPSLIKRAFRLLF